MKINRNTVLVGCNVALVPYRKQHVPRYHEWMKDPLIQEQTASEPLSLEEEYEMQQSWAVDEDKLTFIILALPQEHHDASDVDTIVSRGKMVGDVNIFFNQRHEEEEQDQGDQTREKQCGSTHSVVFDAECEIMIAGELTLYRALRPFMTQKLTPDYHVALSSEHSHRRKGIARQALQMMFSFVTSQPTPKARSLTELSHARSVDVSSVDSAAASSVNKQHCTLPIPSDWLTCKISLSNNASIKLFESLGFARHTISEVWQEVEMRFSSTDAALRQQCDKAIRQILFWQDG